MSIDRRDEELRDRRGEEMRRLTAEIEKLRERFEEFFGGHTNLRGWFYDKVNPLIHEAKEREIP